MRLVAQAGKRGLDKRSGIAMHHANPWWPYCKRGTIPLDEQTPPPATVN